MEPSLAPLDGSEGVRLRRVRLRLRVDAAPQRMAVGTTPLIGVWAREQRQEKDARNYKSYGNASMQDVAHTFLYCMFVQLTCRFRIFR
jgi:hypothetical protein